MAAVQPAQLSTAMEGIQYNIDGSDVDAEGEEDLEAEYSIAHTPAVGTTNGGQSSDVDAPSEEEDAGNDSGGEEFVGAVKIPEEGEDSDEGAHADDTSYEEPGEEDEEDEDEDEQEEDYLERASGSEESAVDEVGWQEADRDSEDDEVKVANRNNCIFCEEDEAHPPNEDDEDFMACAVCGDNAHAQCARDAKSLSQENGDEQWTCPGCTNNALGDDESEVTEAITEKVQEKPLSRRGSSVPNLPKELLPAARGIIKPGSHSVFNELVLPDDPLDGSRSLRKRKSSEAADAQSKTSSKRRKRQSSADSESFRSPSTSMHDEDDAVVDGLAGVSIGPMSRRQSNDQPRTRPARSRRPNREVTIRRNVKATRRNSTSLVITISVDFARLKALQSQKKRKRSLPTVPSTPHPHFAVSSETNRYSMPMYSSHEQDNSDLKSKPYGGILSDTEADTSRTMPIAADRTTFERARQKAEELWKIKTAASEAESELKGRASQKISGPPSKIKCIYFGGFEIDTWYAAPYPEEYSRNRCLFMCEFCLKYMNSDFVAWRHKLKCPAKHPPGDEIYRDGLVSIFEVDGRKSTWYCQNLCLLAKLFLGSKTLYYDVEPFLFYILTERDQFGYHFVGYFSKEKRPSSLNNVSCILTLPTHQRKGYGNLLIDFSYLLTRVEGKTGSPEKPLSDMGLVSYRNYWQLVLSYLLVEHSGPCNVSAIAKRTGMTLDDVVSTLEALRALTRDPMTGTYAFRLDKHYFRSKIEAWEAKNYVKLHPDALCWTPFVMGRGDLALYERAPPLSTIAPREGEEEEKAASGDTVQQKDGENRSGEGGGDDSKEEVNGNAQVLLDANTGSSSINGASDHLALKSNLSIPSPGWFDGPSALLEYSEIPPTRFEVFPPVPGTVSRRRGGWRGGLRKSNVPISTANTPVRRTASSLQVHLNGSNSPGTNGIEYMKAHSPLSNGVNTPNGRRTRSMLGEETLDTEGEERADDRLDSEHDDRADDESPKEAEDVDGGDAGEVNGGAMSIE